MIVFIEISLRLAQRVRALKQTGRAIKTGPFFIIKELITMFIKYSLFVWIEKL